jgi:hypothetical protein
MASIKFVDKTEKEQIIKGTPRVPYDKSKKLMSMDGSVSLYYIDIQTAFNMKIDSKVDFSQKHPQNKNFALITIPIERI